MSPTRVVFILSLLVCFNLKAFGFAPLLQRRQQNGFLTLKSEMTRHSEKHVIFKYRTKLRLQGTEKDTRMFNKRETTPVDDFAMWGLLPSMFVEQSNAQACQAEAESYTGYVPAGLTKEQYLSLKQKEHRGEQKKEYGMWGPRFAPAERPEGDWMVQTSLWTEGFVAQSSFGGSKREEDHNGKSRNITSKTSRMRIAHEIFRWLRFYRPVVFLTFTSSLLVSATTGGSPRPISMRAFTDFPVILKDAVQACRQTTNFITFATPIFKNLIFSVVASPFVDKIMDVSLNQKLKWSRKRCLVTWTKVNKLLAAFVLGWRCMT